jgi:hypothetical protein
MTFIFNLKFKISNEWWIAHWRTSVQSHKYKSRHKLLWENRHISDFRNQTYESAQTSLKNIWKISVRLSPIKLSGRSFHEHSASDHFLATLPVKLIHSQKCFTEQKEKKIKEEYWWKRLTATSDVMCQICSEWLPILIKHYWNELQAVENKRNRRNYVMTEEW